MRSAITSQQIYKFFRPSFYLSQKKYWDRNPINGIEKSYYQRGHYQSKEITVLFYIDVNPFAKNREFVYFNINANYKGKCYSRNFNQLYSERGIQLVCAKFIRDILQNKIKKNDTKR
jgi:hypothetical protein